MKPTSSDVTKAWVQMLFYTLVTSYAKVDTYDQSQK